tara:strand:- start:227 stop:505 length:279 start_codon:yes stop_codon:yes gene_type:complete
LEKGKLFEEQQGSNGENKTCDPSNAAGQNQIACLMERIRNQRFSLTTVLIAMAIIVYLELDWFSGNFGEPIVIECDTFLEEISDERELSNST